MDKETTDLLQTFWPYANSKGAASRNPFIIVALLLARSLGDFVDQCLFAATTAGQFEHAHLHVYFRDDRPYKSDIVSMLPSVRGIWMVRGDHALPLDAFDDAFAPPIKVPSDEWYQAKCECADLVLTPRMMSRAALPGFKSITHLRLPPERTKELDARLRGRGVDPENWFCVLHYREPNYEFRRAEENRDLEPGVAVEVARHVIDDLGGQVVRVGHKEMAKFPNLPGFVDLAAEEDALLLHAYAVSRSRFFLELSPSGPVSLAWALGVPVLRCNCVSIIGPLDDRSIVLPKKIIRPDGRRMSTDEMINTHAFSDTAMRELLIPQGYRYEPNSLAELKVASQDIFNSTIDCTGWRTAAAEPASTLANQFVLPPIREYHHTVADHDELEVPES